jgi:hypothetical protein
MVATKKQSPKPAVDPDLVPSDPGIEVWQNTTPGTVYITRIGEYGKRLSELIYGGRVFSITPQERRLNQNACARPGFDMFTNGTLQPMTLLDGEPDTPRLRQNPNMVDEKEIPKLFRLRGEAFAERINTITNTATISRLLELARDARYNVTVQQFEMLRRRERAIAGDTETDTPAPSGDAGLPRAVTPK